MMNLFELEMQMKENIQQADKKTKSTFYAQVPLMDWLLGTAAASLMFIL
ncbi:hypothetical protein ACFQI7_21820 [Paenibacillus allorhizosphaerae]|uniref:Uncharacterized protein n=1 Tax=Paenibacillus allorhizosphaerae TaxID=2849866 RepID=A0ABM8VN30_9BACL|nr:hypothetical protein [Paenibacillus allorhizosphaerae]CAG7650802.1 hypothetical protein PAECIP111802_04809 [Paenibacillus allorhizosphaerae]